jgi:hypothetical protein
MNIRRIVEHYLMERNVGRAPVGTAAMLRHLTQGVALTGGSDAGGPGERRRLLHLAVGEALRQTFSCSVCADMSPAATMRKHVDGPCDCAFTREVYLTFVRVAMARRSQERAPEWEKIAPIKIIIAWLERQSEGRLPARQLNYGRLSARTAYRRLDEWEDRLEANFRAQHRTVREMLETIAEATQGVEKK